MKKKLTKFLSLLLASVLTISNATPTFAYNVDANGNSIDEVTYQSSDEEDFSNETSVLAQIGSLYEVTIPKVIVLSGITKTASYYVDVTGDIAGSETIKVVPDESVVLSSNNKDDVTGTISQDKTSWAYADLGTKANGQVVANDLTSGKWSGTFWFNISLEGGEVLGDIQDLVSLDNVLKFNSSSDFTLKANEGKSWDGTLEYTVDNGTTWNTWDGSEINGTATQSIYLRGTNNTVITGDYKNKQWVITGTNVECHGNIENLLDYQTVANGEHPTMGQKCYSGIFRGCTSLTAAPALPATTLAEYCYLDMFNGCTSLTTAPELPATTLAKSCYSQMFYGCKSLTTAPELPATKLVGSCYYAMFYNCTSLTTAPKLPATKLAEGCCYCMFDSCTSLTTAPELPAMTLADSCYENMFKGCTSLKTAPEKLPARTLAEDCYYSMFHNCTSLTTAPALPATELANDCYHWMFYNCKSLTTAPELPATTLDYGCYYSMFEGCTSLKLSKTKTGEYQYAYRIPMSGTGKYDPSMRYVTKNSLDYMFTNTGGTFTGTPTINTTYYTTKPPVK